MSPRSFVRATLGQVLVLAALVGCAAVDTSGTHSGGVAVALKAEAGHVTAGDELVLSWRAPGARHCRAHGAWSGDKPAGGAEPAGRVATPRAYNLYCSGDAGTGSALFTAVPAPAGSGLFGTIDSALIRRDAARALYVFAGDQPSPDAAVDAPVAIVPVVQAVGGCTWHYVTEPLPGGAYTISLASWQPGALPDTPSAVTFSTPQRVQVADRPVRRDLRARRVLRVGPGRSLPTPSAAAAVARRGDVIEIDRGEYLGDTATWRAHDLTVRGVDGFAHLRAAGRHVDDKAIWVVQGDRFTVENIEFSEATVRYTNGAGIRQEADDLTVCNGFFHDNENGILGGGGDVLIEHSEFARNGFGDGYSHNMYITNTARFTLRYSYVHHARIGHNVKSRARETRILYNRIMDELAGNSSYLVDTPNGGLVYVVGNVMHQSIYTDNTALIAFAAEGAGYAPVDALYVAHNTLVNDLGSGRFVHNFDDDATATVVNNLFVGRGVLLEGHGELAGNVHTSTPGFIDAGGYDYRPTGDSPARDAGTAQTAEPELVPTREYRHSASAADRHSDGIPDAGAFEFVPQ